MSMLAQAARGIKNMWSQGDDEEEEDYDSSDDSETTAPSKHSSDKYASDKYASDKYSSEKYVSDKTPTEKYSSDFGGGSGSNNRARSLRTVPIPMRAREKNIYTLRPKNQDEAAIAADYLKSGSAVVMNLETVEKPVAMRIIDFMSGVCYGLEGQGHAMKLGDSIFLFTPAEFEISSDELDYGENRDFFFKDIDKKAGEKPLAPQAQHQPLQQQAMRAGQVAAPQQSTPQGGQGIGSQGAGSVLLPPAQNNSQGPISSSGYATADYTAPHAPTSIAAPVISAPARNAEPPIAPIVQASTLPASSVYGSGGKAHVLIGGKPASVNTSTGNVSPSISTSPQSSYQSSERRSWER